MVEALMARGYATPNPYAVKRSPDTVGPMDRKEIAELEARHKADMARKYELEEREIEKIREQAKHEAAHAADQVKRAADEEKIARAEQKRPTRLKELRLEGITGTPGRRIAVIKGYSALLLSTILLWAYLHAMQALGVTAQETWMIGDNLEWEVEAPQRLGIYAIWIDVHGDGLPAESAVKPDRIIRSLAELVPAE